MAKYDNRHRRADHHTESDKEVSVSISPRCFYLVESGEGESTFEISNNNPYSLYFKLLTTNAFAMCFQPKQGKLEPHSKVECDILFTVHFASSQKIF
ncbi:hypothetical protein AVEN_266294-1 [Araneus ventricosus]|uniref:MSP domain-containing protein n=1 Tax=Araneus ventricosus TaxID=182803 RepID=A0A4Y2ECJ9_ARAVE|nr:hypothetical protein AVEN_266294-1 [Araneus ventricosus]